MVTAIKSTLPSFQLISQPQFVELAGMAGSGKSTLARTLCHYNSKFILGQEIAFRDGGQLPVFAHSLPLVLWSFFDRCMGTRRWTWNEIKFQVYLKRWDQVLKHQLDRNQGILLLDHGPVFKMASLHAFGPDWLRSASAQSWWGELFQKWAGFLDRVIWLDAPDAILETRINRRKQNHPVKGKTGQEVRQFLALYRSSYCFVLSGLAAFDGPAVIHFDTSQASLEETAGGILSTFGIEPENRR